MHCFIDLHIVTNSIHLLLEVPHDFVQSERTANELHLQGDNDSIQCAQVVTTTFINKNYGTSTPIFAPSPQVIGTSVCPFFEFTCRASRRPSPATAGFLLSKLATVPPLEIFLELKLLVSIKLPLLHLEVEDVVEA